MGLIGFPSLPIKARNTTLNLAYEVRSPDLVNFGTTDNLSWEKSEVTS